jgi:hypothetical protein
VHDDEIAARVARDAGIPDLVELLGARLPPTDLQSLLLAVYRRRAAELTPGDLLARYEQNPFTQPSAIDPVALLELDRLAFRLLPDDWQRIELAPVCPLGTTSVLGKLSQDRAVATVRNTEVLSDATNVLALECARQRRLVRRSKAGATAQIKLCASARLLRSQPYAAPFLPHFRLLGLVTAGRDTGSFGFELAAAVEHLDFYVRVLRGVADLGIEIDRLEVSITDLGVTEASIEGGVIELMSLRHPGIELKLDPERQVGRGYYAGLCFWVHGTTQGRRLQLADGGCTNWTQALLSDRKERLLISGMGSELLCGQAAAAATR